MAIQIVNLRGVPEDEAEEIRELLEAQDFDFYETPGGSWGMSQPGFWLKDESQLASAKEVLAVYQRDRTERMAAEYQQLREQGEQPTLWRNFQAAPLRYIIYLILIVLVLYFSIKPFFSL